MNHPVVMDPDGSDMPMNILIPYLLCGIADVLEVTEFRNPYHPGLEESPDHDFIVVCNMKFLIMTADGFIKRFPPGPYMVRR